MKKSSVNKVSVALKKELQRSMQHLKVPGHPRPYYLSYLFRHNETFEVWARYGAVCSDKSDVTRSCFADVRVGSHSYDQVTKGGLADNSTDAHSSELLDLPLDDDEDAIRFGLWRLTDARYREAVSQFHKRKSNDINYLDQNKVISSFQKRNASRSVPPLKKQDVNKRHFRSLVRKASLLFKKYPEIKASYCEFSSEVVTKIFVNSEGTEEVWQQPVFSLSAHLWYHTKKVNEDYTLCFHTASLEEIPTYAAFAKAIEEKVEQCYGLEKSHEMTSCAGPVLLAPQPAGVFLHEVIGHRLEGSRLLSDSEGRTFKDRTEQMIMHPRLSVCDDPSLQTFAGKSLVGHFRVDDEGVPSRRTSLVEKGVLKGFLTTRSPVQKGDHQSNGHARNRYHERPVSRMGNLIIESHDGNSWEELKELLIQQVKAQNVPYGIVLLEVEGGETATETYDFQAFLGQITAAVKVYATGREVMDRGVDFVGTPLSSLANIVAVGKDYGVENGFCGAESGTIPVSTVSPAILLSSLELQLKSPAKVTQYALPLPWFDQKRRSGASSKGPGKKNR